MGLTMYLFKKHYIEEHERGALHITGLHNPERATYIIEEAGYWWRANQVHRWFVENVQNGQDNCATYTVGHDQLQRLLNTINTVLENPRKANKLLPAMRGPLVALYGSEEDYFDQLRETKKIIEDVLDGDICDLEYTSYW